MVCGHRTPHPAHFDEDQCLTASDSMNCHTIDRRRGESNMQTMRMLVLAAMIAVLAGGGGQAQAPAPQVKTEASVGATKQPVTARIKAWTSTQWAAANKLWAENEAKFSECKAKLAAESKVRKLRIRERRNFLSGCMSR
jgi:hypothetical protein